MELKWNLQLFAANNVVNGTNGYVNANSGQVTPFTDNSTLSPQNKTFYDTALLENAREQHYFGQFGSTQTLPRNRGQAVEWRKWATLPKAMKPLTEGVTPDGQKMHQTVLTQEITQHGDYVQLTDKIQLHAIDNVVLAATEELGAAAGNTQDALTRNELMTGTNVLYCDHVASNGTVTPVNRRYNLDSNCRLTPKMVNKAVTILKKANAPKINGKYVALVHPSVAEDLRESEAWIEAHKYAAPEQLFNGEIGELHGVRFIESNTVRVWSPADLLGSGVRKLTVSAAYVSNATTTATDGMATSYRLTISETPEAGLVGRVLNLEVSGDVKEQMEIVGVNTTSKYLYLAENLSTTIGANPSATYLIPGEGGAERSATPGAVAVYGCMFIGKDAYGVVDPAGGNMETIVKPLGSGGTSDPLNQRSSVGYKFETAAKILYPERLLRVECGSSYSDVDEDNA